MAQEWDIKPRGDACSGCRTPFEDGQSIMTGLIFSEDGYVRVDACEGCWPARVEEDAPYSTWRGRFVMPPPAPDEALKKETAESLLRRLIDDGGSEKENVVYILAVMLERKRTLIERDVRVGADGSVVHVYEHRHSGETFLVHDPGLRLDQLEKVQQDVVDMLGGQVDKETPAPAEAAETPDDLPPDSPGTAPTGPPA